MRHIYMILPEPVAGSDHKEFAVFMSAFPIISTPDLVRSLRFYRDLLDGGVTYQFPHNGGPGVRVDRNRFVSAS